MDNHAKRNPRGLVASAIFAAMLGLGSGAASATVIDFNVDPGGLPADSFSTGGFDFVFTAAGDGPAQNPAGFIFTAGGEGGTGGIEAESIFPNLLGEEIITIIRTGGGLFTFSSIYIDSLGPENTIVEGLNGAMTPFTTNVGAGMGTVMTGGVVVDTVRLRSQDFNRLVFDTFTFSLTTPPMAMPEPGTLALFLTGLIGLSLLSRRRRQPMA